MFDKIFQCLEGNLGNFRAFLEHFHAVVAVLSENYMKDGNARDACIDSLIEYLQTLKTKKS